MLWPGYSFGVKRPQGHLVQKFCQHRLGSTYLLNALQLSNIFFYYLFQERSSRRRCTSCMTNTVSSSTSLENDWPHGSGSPWWVTLWLASLTQGTLMSYASTLLMLTIFQRFSRHSISSAAPHNHSQSLSRLVTYHSFSKATYSGQHSLLKCNKQVKSCVWFFNIHGNINRSHQNIYRLC